MKQGIVFSRFQWESNCVRRQLIQGDAALLPLPVGEGWGEGVFRSWSTQGRRGLG